MVPQRMVVAAFESDASRRGRAWASSLPAAAAAALQQPDGEQMQQALLRAVRCGAACVHMHELACTAVRSAGFSRSTASAQLRRGRRAPDPRCRDLGSLTPSPLSRTHALLTHMCRSSGGGGGELLVPGIVALGCALLGSCPAGEALQLLRANERRLAGAEAEAEAARRGRKGQQGAEARAAGAAGAGAWDVAIVLTVSSCTAACKGGDCLCGGRMSSAISYLLAVHCCVEGGAN